MTLRDLVLRLAAMLSPKRSEQELAEELSFHVEMQARKHRDAGMTPEAAMRRARVEFGNVELVKEDARDVRGLRRFEQFAQDIRYAMRAFRHAPSFALTVALTIGLGVGINSSVFTIFNAYVLRPFEVRDPYALYSVAWADRSGQFHDFTYRDYQNLRRAATGDAATLSDVAAFRTVSARLNGSTSTGDAVTGDYFRTIGAGSFIGRTLLPEDAAQSQGSPVIVLSYAAWRNRFGSDSGIVGKRILLRGSTYQVVGVTREGFDGLFKRPRDFWIPLGMAARFDTTLRASGFGDGDIVSLLGRVAPATSEGRAIAGLSSIMRGLTADRPDTARAVRVILTSRASAIPRSIKSYLAFIPIAVAFSLVLLLACANVANMMLARGLARQRELGIRLALGAARGRLIRQLVTESLLLVLPAAVVGAAVAWLAVDVGVRALFATLPADLAGYVRLVPLQPDLRVLAFTLAMAIVSALFFGLVPSLQTTKLSVVQATRGNFDAEYSPTRLRNVLVVVQVSVAALLLITSALLLREGARLGRIDPGLRTRDVVSIETREGLRSDVVARLRVNPLVADVATAAILPLDMRFPTVTVSVGGGSVPTPISFNRVSASYFNILGINILRGRGFSAQEERDGSASVIVSEETARRLWPGGSPVGRSIHLQVRASGASPDPLASYQDAQVVGVAKDVLTQNIENGNQPVLYFPASVETNGCCVLTAVRGDPAQAKRSLDAELERAIPGAIDRMDRLESFVVGAVYPFRAAYWVSLMLGLVALGLTAAGVSGVVSYIVGQRTREIGIRLALGATARQVLTLILSQSIRHATIGIGIGAVLAFGLSRVLGSQIQGMPVFDIVAFVAGAAVVFAACVAAAFVPSHRATSINPTETLRND